MAGAQATCVLTTDRWRGAKGVRAACLEARRMVLCNIVEYIGFGLGRVIGKLDGKRMKCDLWLQSDAMMSELLEKFGALSLLGPVRIRSGSGFPTLPEVPQIAQHLML